MGFIEKRQAELEQAQKAAAFDAAMAQKRLAEAKAAGASEYANGLAKIAAETAYVDANQPQVQVPAGVQMEQGGRAFVTPQTPAANATDAWLAEMRARKMAQ